MLSSIFNYIFNLFNQEDPSRPVPVEVQGTRMIEDMTKRELDELGNIHGLRLDRRRKKEVLVAKLKEAGIHHG